MPHPVTTVNQDAKPEESHLILEGNSRIALCVPLNRATAERDHADCKKPNSAAVGAAVPSKALSEKSANASTGRNIDWQINSHFDLTIR